MLGRIGASHVGAQYGEDAAWVAATARLASIIDGEVPQRGQEIWLMLRRVRCWRELERRSADSLSSRRGVRLGLSIVRMLSTSISQRGREGVGGILSSISVSLPHLRRAEVEVSCV